MHLALLATELPPQPTGPFTPLEWYAIAITGIAIFFVLKWAIPRWVRETAHVPPKNNPTPVPPPPPSGQSSIAALHSIVTGHIASEEADRHEWKNSLDSLRESIDKKFEETKNAVHGLITAFAVAQERQEQLRKEQDALKEQVESHHDYLMENTGRFDAAPDHPQMPPRQPAQPQPVQPRKPTPFPRR